MSDIVAYRAVGTRQEERMVFTAYGQELLGVDEDGNPVEPEEESEGEPDE